MKVTDFHYVANDICVIAACIELVAFSAAPIKKGAPGFLNFYKIFRQLFSDQVTMYSTNTMKRMKTVTNKTLDMVPFYFTDEKSMDYTFGIDLHSGRTSQDAVPPAFEMLCDLDYEKPYSYFRLVLPPDWIRSDPGPFLELTRNALHDFPLLSGYAGFSFFWRVLDSDMDAEAAERYGPWLRRHPGFSYGDTLELAELALEGIVGINWLTLLGHDYVAKIGGAKNTASVLGPDIEVHQIPEGIIVQASFLPKIGDINRKDNLPTYHKVGRFLKKIKAPSEKAWVEGLDPDEKEDWFERFYR